MFATSALLPAVSTDENQAGFPCQLPLNTFPWFRRYVECSSKILRYLVNAKVSIYTPRFDGRQVLVDHNLPNSDLKRGIIGELRQ